MPRLRRSNPGSDGISRRRAGRGFRYVRADGLPETDGPTLERIKALVIPPAWTEVWISPHPNGHIQAVGTDAAGRRQYLYHEHWRLQRDKDKHERVLGMARRLPAARRRATRLLAHDQPTREVVLALAFRLLDVGSFRIGSEAYAKENDTYGLATLLRSQVSVEGRTLTFRYSAKGSADRQQRIVDGRLASLVGLLLDRDDRGPELLAWATDAGWHDVSSQDVNEFVREIIGDDYTAKDFRTWNATVLMAQLLALAEPAGTERARKRVVVDAYRGVADYLGNTPAVARGSYVDPRVVDLYADGVVLPRRVIPARHTSLPVHGAVERAVLRMLDDPAR